MRAPVFVFLRKEMREILRTSKIYVLPSLFLFFGFSSPLLAKLTPELIKLAGENTSGVKIILTAEPTALHAWQQLLKNLGTGLLVIILVFMGTVLDERLRGTTVPVLTKPLKRAEFIWAKFASAALLVTLSTFLAALAGTYYTLILWPARPEIVPGIQAVFLFWIYALFTTALAVLSSTLAKNSMLAAGGAAACHLLLSVLASLGGRFAAYNPGGLMAQASKLIAPDPHAAFADSRPTVVLTILATLFLIWLAGSIFRRQEL